jgi:Na+/H+ antiporter NhaD/arsenite permease-like protein
MKYFVGCLLSLLLALPVFAENGHADILDLTNTWVGYTALAIFAIAYVLVIFEEKLHLRKSKPVLMAAGLIWILLALTYNSLGNEHTVEISIRHVFLEYSELFFFLIVAMTYINALLERGVFAELRNWLVIKGFSYKTLFWLTGVLSFFISPVADNLTTALIMCAVVMAVGEDKPKFVGISCINIVVAANAGGAFSPFGDITTLMVWQKGMIEFWSFFDLFLPSVVNYLIPAFIMQFAIPSGKPAVRDNTKSELKYGGITILILFLATIVTAVSFHNFLHIPPVFGMMTGLGYLKFYGFYLRRKSKAWALSSENPPESKDDPYNFDVFDKIAQSEWDTLFFFYCVFLSVGGLGLIG